jgi:osmotically-inducible protein OsmY
MINNRVHDHCRRRAGWLAVVALSGAFALTLPAAATAQERADSESVRQQNLSAQSSAQHHYASPAERAQDALLIVKVKAAIANQGFADDYPLTVDADHGRVTLTGVLASREDVARTLTLVAGIGGVTGVNNRLSWQKNP